MKRNKKLLVSFLALNAILTSYAQAETVQSARYERMYNSIVKNIEKGNTLDEQIEINDKKQKLEKEIVRLEKQARAEKQPKKKFELVQAEKKLKEKFRYL